MVINDCRKLQWKWFWGTLMWKSPRWWRGRAYRIQIATWLTSGFISKGRTTAPNQMNFLKKFQNRLRSPALIFGKLCCNFVYGRIYARRYEGQMKYEIYAHDFQRSFETLPKFILFGRAIPPYDVHAFPKVATLPDTEPAYAFWGSRHQNACKVLNRGGGDPLPLSIKDPLWVKFYKCHVWHN